METMHSRAKVLLFGQRSSEDIATALRGRGLAAGETEIIESTDTAKALCFAIRGRSNFKHTMWLFAGEIDGDGYALVMISAAGSGPAILEGIAKEFGGYVCRCDDGLTLGLRSNRSGGCRRSRSTPRSKCGKLRPGAPISSATGARPPPRALPGCVGDRMCAEVRRLVGVDRSAVAGKPDPPHASA